VPDKVPLPRAVDRHSRGGDPHDRGDLYEEGRRNAVLLSERLAQGAECPQAQQAAGNVRVARQFVQPLISLAQARVELAHAADHHDDAARDVDEDCGRELR
jgi:hypothetical protein